MKCCASVGLSSCLSHLSQEHNEKNKNYVTHCNHMLANDRLSISFFLKQKKKKTNRLLSVSMRNCKCLFYKNLKFPEQDTKVKLVKTQKGVMTTEEVWFGQVSG